MNVVFVEKMGTAVVIRCKNSSALHRSTVLCELNKHPDINHSLQKINPLLF